VNVKKKKAKQREIKKMSRKSKCSLDDSNEDALLNVKNRDGNRCQLSAVIIYGGNRTANR